MRSGTIIEKRLGTYHALQDAFIHRRSSCFPLVLEIEPTTDCNLICRFCPREKLMRPKGRLSRPDCEGILENLGPPPSPCMLLFSGFGEPMCNTDLACFLAAAKKRGWTCGVTTNGSLLSRSSLEPLLHAGLDILQVSLHAATEKTYQTIVKHGSLGETTDRIRSILPLCKERIVVAMNYTLCSWNRHETGRFAKMWKGAGVDCVNFSSRHNRGGFLADPSGSRTRVPVHPRGATCWIRKHAGFVTWNGDLLACCNDLSGVTIRGSLLEKRFETLRQRGSSRLDDRTESLCLACDFPFRREK